MESTYQPCQETWKASQEEIGIWDIEPIFNQIFTIETSF